MEKEVTQVAKETATDSKKSASKKEKPRLLAFYETKVVPALEKELGYKNINQVPRLNKIVVNAGLGDVKDNAKSFNMAGLGRAFTAKYSLKPAAHLNASRNAFALSNIAFSSYM